MPNKETTVEDVLASLQGGITNKPQYNFTLDGGPVKMGGPESFKGVEYTTPKSAVYNRLSDGTYVPRFENYVGAEGNEDRLAAQQGTFEQMTRGLGKAGVKTLAYATDAIVGTAYGIYKGISEGSWDAVWNNEVSNSIDDFNKRLDSNLVNYYSDEEKSNGLLAAIPGFGATNFWFNDVAGGLAFVAGAILPELAIGALSGGSTLGVSAGKMGLKAGLKGLTKSGLKAGVKETSEKGVLGTIKKYSGYNKYKEGSDVIRGLNHAVLGKTAGDIFGTATFLARTSNFEAGMEARHNFHTAVERYYEDFEEFNGRMPTAEEASEFMEGAKSAANGVYAANLAILSVSNAVMFSDKFKIGVQSRKRLSQKANKFIGLEPVKKAGAKTVVKDATRGQKILGNTYFRLGKPAVEGLYEEGFQGVAGTTMQNYMESKYNPEIESSYDHWAALSDAFAHQYGTKEGWKEMGIGMIIGSMGGVMQKGQPNFSGFGKGSRKAKQEQLVKSVERSNKGQSDLIARMNKSSALSDLSGKVAKKDANNEASFIEHAMIHQEYIASQEGVKSHKEILEDYNAVVDNMVFDDSEIIEAGLDNTMTIDEHKSSLKSEFKRNMNTYNKAKRAVEAIGLNDARERGFVKDSKGNRKEVEDYLVRSIMLGENALNGAEQIGKQIDELIGEEGAFSALQFYNNSSKEEQKKIEELSRKTKDLENLEKEYTNYANKIAGLPSRGRGRFAEETKHSKQKEAADKALAANLRMNELRAEIQSLSEDVASSKTARGFNANNVVNTKATPEDIINSVKEFDKLDGFITSLRKNERKKDASQLEYLIEEYKMHSDAHREMENGFRRMLDTNFFSTKTGKGLVKSIVGDRYKMSEEFKKALKENDAIIDKSLRKVGIRGAETVEDLLKSQLEENEELSDREKFRLESILRLELGYKKLNEVVEEIEKEAKETNIKAEKETTPSPLKGDTVQLKTRLNAEGKDLGNVEILDKIINKMLKALEEFKIGKVNNAKIQDLSDRLDKLRTDRKAIDKEALESQIKGLREEITKAKNDKNTEVVSELEAKIEETKAKLPKELDAEIKAVEEELKVAENTKEIRIIKSPEYRRLYELNSKKANKEITPEEVEELRDLEEDIDQWMMITGTVAEGLRLSDLIQQKAILESTTIAEINKVETPTVQEITDSADIQDTDGNAHYSFAQSYDGVTVIRKDGEFEVSGRTFKEFAEDAGIPLSELKVKKVKGKDTPTAIFKVNDKGNILITEEVVDRINKLGKVNITATNKSLVTNYSMVLKTTETPEGGTETVTLKSNFKDKSFRTNMNTDAIYDMENGEEVTLLIDPKDEHNVELIANYKKAKSVKKKQEAKDALRKGAVVQVRRKTGKEEFVAVLKGKRKGGDRNKNLSDKFEALRDQIIDDESIFEPFIDGSPLKLGFEGITVSTVYIGHPNFNYSKNEAGAVSINTKLLTKSEIDNVEDIGFYDKDGAHTMSGKKDGLKTTFVAKAIKEDSTMKIPFVVVKKGNQRIIVPVTIAPNEKENLQQFKDIYDSRMALVDKASALNVFMAGRGLDIKEEGNSFLIAGTTNMNDKFFSDKLAQLEEINYFRDLETWAKAGGNMNRILSQGVSSSINLKDPLHSPKIKLDFEGLDIEIQERVSEEVESETKKTKKKTTKKSLGKLDTIIKRNNEKDC